MAHLSIDRLVLGTPLPTLRVHRQDGLDMVTNANALARDIFGADIVDKPVFKVLRDAQIFAMLDRVFDTQTNQSCRFQRDVVRSAMYYEATAIWMGPDQAVVQFVDLTDLETANQMRRDFVSNVSHELKTPLAALMGFIETLLGPARNDAAAHDRFLNIMNQEAQRMNRLVSDLLSLSRVEETERKRPTNTVCVNDVLTSSLEVLHPTAKAANVRIDTVGLDQPVHILGDWDQMIQVCVNLMENAIKYGGSDNTVVLTLVGSQYDPTLRKPCAIIRVKDHGPGIDAIHLPRLAERFYRVDDHRDRKTGGTGLGLAIVKHIVTRHRGRMAVQSKRGQGAEFSIILPLASEINADLAGLS